MHAHPNVAAEPVALAAPADSSGMSSPERSLALVRVVVGLWFLKSLFTKLTLTLVAGVLPVPTATERWIGFLPRRLEGWAESNPIGWYRDFLLEVAIPHAPTFAQLTAFGESLVGISLTLGLLTGAGALGGIFLLLNYVIASIGEPFNQQGLHVVLLACMLAFFAARAGRCWGVDGWLVRRFPRLLRRLPLA